MQLNTYVRFSIAKIEFCSSIKVWQRWQGTDVHWELCYTLLSAQHGFNTVVPELLPAVVQNEVQPHEMGKGTTNEDDDDDDSIAEWNCHNSSDKTMVSTGDQPTRSRSSRFELICQRSTKQWVASEYTRPDQLLRLNGIIETGLQTDLCRPTRYRQQQDA